MTLHAPPSAEAIDERGAAPDDATDDPHDGCELLLVADRTRGATHRFFAGWRFEAVGCAAPSGPGATLFAAPLAPNDRDAPGRRYDLALLPERPGSCSQGRIAFAWTAREEPRTPDPLADALGRARDWLAARGWERDPLDPTRYRRPAPPAVVPPPRAGLSADSPRLPAGGPPGAPAPHPTVDAQPQQPGARPA